MMSNNNLVIIYQGKNLGDVLLSTPVVQSYSRYDGGAKFVVICRKSAAAIYEDHPAVIDILDSPKTILQLLRLVLDIARLRWRYQQYVFIDLHGCSKSSLLARFTSPNQSVKIRTPQGYFFDKYTVENSTLVGVKHTIDNNLSTLRSLGVNSHFLKKNIDLTGIKRLSHAVNINGFDCLKPFVVIHPGTRWTFKTLSVEKWTMIINHVAKLTRAPILLTGGDDEVEANFCMSIETSVDVPLTNIAGTTSISELAAIIKSACFYVGVDSFASHLASGSGIPGVVLFGPTDELVWGPTDFSRLQLIVSDAHPCRPCNRAGCDDSKISDCLVNIDDSLVIDAIDKSWLISQ